MNILILLVISLHSIFLRFYCISIKKTIKNKKNDFNNIRVTKISLRKNIHYETCDMEQITIWDQVSCSILHHIHHIYYIWYDDIVVILYVL